MNVANDELKSELAKLLDGTISTEHRAGVESEPFWLATGNAVLESEWSFVCYLVRVKYNVPVLVGWNEPWQEQARYLLRHMAARESVAEAKA